MTLEKDSTCSIEGFFLLLMGDSSCSIDGYLFLTPQNDSSFSIDGFLNNDLPNRSSKIPISVSSALSDNGERKGGF